MENKASTGAFQKHENNKLAYVFLAFLQGKRRITRTFSDIRKTDGSFRIYLVFAVL